MATNRTSTPPPLHDLPTAKEKKYDRQLRLWGATGQQALEDTHILLINNGSGVTGVETLKNLVLPGIGHFTILDAAVVEPADLGVNFFLDDHTLGGFRAEHTARLLNELNPDVEGHFITEVSCAGLLHCDVVWMRCLFSISVCSLESFGWSGTGNQGCAFILHTIAVSQC